MDRLSVAVRTLHAAGVAIDPDVVLRGTELEDHPQRGWLLERMATIVEAIAGRDGADHGPRRK